MNQTGVVFFLSLSQHRQRLRTSSFHSYSFFHSEPDQPRESRARVIPPRPPGGVTVDEESLASVAASPASLPRCCTLLLFILRRKSSVSPSIARETVQPQLVTRGGAPARVAGRCVPQLLGSCAAVWSFLWTPLPRCEAGAHIQGRGSAQISSRSLLSFRPDARTCLQFPVAPLSQRSRACAVISEQLEVVPARAHAGHGVLVCCEWCRTCTSRNVHALYVRHRPVDGWKANYQLSFVREKHVHQNICCVLITISTKSIRTRVTSTPKINGIGVGTSCLLLVLNMFCGVVCSARLFRRKGYIASLYTSSPLEIGKQAQCRIQVCPGSRHHLREQHDTQQ